ncbi:hypothetical protein BJF92_09720 [Rhizobium rhizosphaerae]|uniref:LPS-assembly lipoprotein n=1 Tax=Xaviernesmea rhizosphaerae TaxID=1672749 RepID=A0A1Q9AGB3_9HYPH|nr:hypothetical protein [Xaviernesmea rhizosphaerae]OLP54012.1 hypothetical protein BJF92_09720 [Xaviernesmea rhizosphaerae]
MSLSDLAPRALRAGLLGLGLAGMLLASGCQVRPLYADGATGIPGTALAAIAIEPPKDRVTQVVRNRLIFLTSGGAGQPANPAYHLALTVKSNTEGVLYDQRSSRDTNSDMATAGRVTIMVDYNLTRISDGKTVASGHRTAVALVDFSVQEFAKLRAIRDGEDRAGKEVAEVIRADLAAGLAREPAPAVAPTKG